MNRIKITLPEIFEFSTRMTIRITDLNYGGHVGNDTFLSLIQEARQQFLHAHGYSELSFAGYGLIMADAMVAFKRELGYGDTVKISVAAADFDRLGFDLFYKLELLTGEDTVLVGKAKTGMLCFDYTTKKKVPVPPEVLKKFGVTPDPTS